MLTLAIYITFAVLAICLFGCAIEIPEEPDNRPHLRIYHDVAFRIRRPRVIHGGRL